MIVTQVSGPLFEGKIHVAQGTKLGIERATARAAEFARARLRSSVRFSTAKYGHASQSVRTRTYAVGGGDQYIGRAYIGGQAAYLAPWLEYGVKRHPIPSPKRPKRRTRIEKVRSSRGIRRAVITTTNALLAMPLGGGRVFRTYTMAKPFWHKGSPATHWASKSQADIDRIAPDIIRQALTESGA